MVPWYWMLWPFALIAAAIAGAFVWAAITETEQDRERVRRMRQAP
jgi:hypothetical protein